LRVFFNPKENRLRAGWRLLLQAVVLVVFTIAFGPAVGLFTGPRAGVEDAPVFLVATIATSVTVTLSVVIGRRFFDRRSFAGLGLRSDGKGLRDLSFGIGLTGLMMGCIFLAEVALGWTRLEGFGAATGAAAFLGSLLLWLAIFVMVGWYEELLSRGYWLRNMTEGSNLPLAVLLSSAAFAALHSGNPGASWRNFAGLFVAGVWFAFAAVRSRGLWLPIGAHIGWNFFEGVVFGFPVSGLDTPRLLRQAAAGDPLWTGGGFGPEAGLILLPALALGALAIWAYTRGRNRDTDARGWKHGAHSRASECGAAPKDYPPSASVLP
jgi:hypothetical protein